MRFRNWALAATAAMTLGAGGARAAQSVTLSGKITVLSDAVNLFSPSLAVGDPASLRFVLNVNTPGTVQESSASTALTNDSYVAGLGNANPISNALLTIDGSTIGIEGSTGFVLHSDGDNSLSSVPGSHGTLNPALGLLSGAVGDHTYWLVNRGTVIDDTLPGESFETDDRFDIFGIPAPSGFGLDFPTGVPFTVDFIRSFSHTEFHNTGPVPFDDGSFGVEFTVDSVSIASVPEPAAWALMLAGFGAAGAALRRRRAALA